MIYFHYMKNNKSKTIKHLKRDLFFEFESESESECFDKKENNYLHKHYFNNCNKKLSETLENL